MCIGSELATLESILALKGLFRRLSNPRLADETPHWHPNLNFRGLDTLIVASD
jgi:cytochrome P450